MKMSTQTKIMLEMEAAEAEQLIELLRRVLSDVNIAEEEYTFIEELLSQYHIPT